MKLTQLKALISQPLVAAAIVEAGSAVKALTGELIAARNGAISPLVTTPADERLIHRLVTEKTVTVNTTAAGGNASLMTMSDNIGLRAASEHYQSPGEHIVRAFFYPNRQH